MSEPTPPPPGPSWLEALSNPFPAPVVLRTSLTVNGAEYGYQQCMPRRDWEAISRDPAARAGYEQQLRAMLGQAIVERLNPPVTVEVPPPPVEGADLVAARMALEHAPGAAPDAPGEEGAALESGDVQQAT